MTLDRKRAAELLHDTAYLIDGVKAEEYGEPQESFETIASLWTTYLNSIWNVEHVITIPDVGMLMVLMKVARTARGRFHRDNYVDICGYAALVGSDGMDSGQGLDPDAQGRKEWRPTSRPSKIHRRKG